MNRSGFLVLSAFGLFVTSLLATDNSTVLRADDDTPTVHKLALLVGVKVYRHASLRDLDYPERDVTELAAVLKSQQFEVVTLSTELAKTDPTAAPTADNIRQRLSQLLTNSKVGKRDVVLVGLAGHGIQPAGSGEAYFCPMDANPTIEGNKPQKPATLIALGVILKQLDDSGIGHKLLLVDACRNDPGTRGRRGVERVDVSALPPQTGVLLSCAPGEFSFEHKSLGGGHGVFFYHVIAGLKGAARNVEDPEVTWDGLRSYVKRKVPATVKILYGKDGGEQQPNDIGNLIGTPTVLAMATLLTTGSRQGEIRDDNGIAAKLVWIPPGEFTMGSPPDETNRRDYEKQVHVTLKGFWLGQHEVTQSQWQQVMQTTPWEGKDHVKVGDDYPATYVSWDDAITFCERLTTREQAANRLPAGWQYTLPTEAQWEFTCRAGTTTRFSFGNDDPDISSFGWWGGMHGDGNAKDQQYAHPVAQKKANAWGLRDMHGNVWEWCRDIFVTRLPGGDDPEVKSGGSDRIMRGGAWYGLAWFCRSANRGHNEPSFRFDYVGFKLALCPTAKGR